MNVPLTWHFSVFDPGGPTAKQSGIANGSFTKTAYRNGVVTALTVTVAEVGSTGEYIASATFATTGVWKVEIVPPDGSQITYEDIEVLDLPAGVSASLTPEAAAILLAMGGRAL